MKKKKIFALTAAALSLAACSTNDIADITANDADNVVNVASVTRSAEGGTTTTTSPTMTAPFHLVNLTQKKEYGWKYEADYTYTTSQYAPTNGLVVWCNIKDDKGNNVQNEFKAFSPLHTVANEASDTTFQILPDQSTSDKLAAADWMTAETTMAKFNKEGVENNLDLNFKHRNAKLHFDVSLKNDITSSNVALSSDDFKVVGFITPYYTESGTDKTIEAIVYAGKDYSGENLIEMTINFDENNSETYEVSLPTDLTQFEAGKQYNFNLTIGHDKATISSVSVTNWNDSNIELNGNDDAINYRVVTENGVRTYIVSDFSGFKAWLDNGNGASIKLESDITVPDGTNFPYISEISDGIIDGQGHTIKNIKTFEDGKTYIFNTNKGIIKNLNFEIDINSYSSFLGIVSKNEGTIENCTISGSANIPQDNYRYFSGVCKTNSQNGTIIACVNNVTVTQNTGDITGTIISGGICNENGGLIFGCINNGDISLVSSNNANNSLIAGIAAKSYLDGYSKSPGKIIACANTGTITGDCPIFHKYTEGSTIAYCYWTQGSESATNMTNSGIVTSWDDTTISNLNSAKDGDGEDAKSIQDYGYEFKTDSDGKLIIVKKESNN